MRALIAVVFGTLLSTCSTTPSLLDRIIDQGELRVVTRNSPTTFYYGTDYPRGIEYELAQGFAERLGVNLSIELADQPGQILPAISEGRADIAAAGLNVTGTSADLVDFGPAYERSKQLVIRRRGGPRARTVEDLLGSRIEVVADSPYVRTLEIARRDYPMLRWQEEPGIGIEELISRVVRGEIDYTIVDSNLFEFLRQYHPEANAAFSIGPQRSIAWALPRDAESLKEQVSAYFAEIRATGKLDEILDRYYFATQDFDYVGSRAFVRHVRTRLPLYRPYFEEAARAAGLDWRLLAAIAYQESHWNPKAVSPTGVRGIMMLTEHTANLVEVSDRDDARESIVGGARYLVRMLDKIPDRIAEPDRLWMALAAYNIGFGHLEDARVITEISGQNPDSWADVRNHLPLLTDENWYSRVRRGYARGDVPVDYVDNVRRYNELLHWVVDDALLDPLPGSYSSPDRATASNWPSVSAAP